MRIPGSTKTFIFLVFYVIYLPAGLNAQFFTSQVEAGLSLNEIALVDVEPGGGTVSLSLGVPTEPGLPMIPENDNSSWLNYSLCISENAADHFISAVVSSGFVPSGLELTIEASPYSGIGAGILGIPSGEITLSQVDQILLEGIRGAYTGDGVSNGHMLTYRLSVSNLSEVDFNQSTNILITYTISE